MTEVHASSAGKEPVEGGNVGMGTQYLEVRGLTVDFDGFKAVSDVDLTLFQGDLRFLIGPNGAGKTTVIDAITGLVPASGSVNKSGVELLGKKVHQIARRGIGRTFQTASVFEELSVLQNLDIETVLLDDLQPTKKYDLVVDCTGSAAGLPIAVQRCKPRGTVVLKTTVAGEQTLSLAPIVIDEITVVGSRCGPFATALSALQQDLIDVLPLISSRFPLEQGDAAIEEARVKPVLKVILDV